MKIENLTNDELINYFEDAISDDTYNPIGDLYNQSGFTLEELRAEIFNRLSNNK